MMARESRSDSGPPGPEGSSGLSPSRGSVVDGRAFPRHHRGRRFASPGWPVWVEAGGIISETSSERCGARVVVESRRV